MKKIIALTAALLSLGAFALNTNTVWHARGETLKIVTKQLSANVTFATKQGAVQGALAMMEDISSGNMSKTAKYAFRRSLTLHDSDDKCQGNQAGFNLRIIQAEMAKGKFEVTRIMVGSSFNAQGTEAFRYSVRYYAPCVKKDKR
jgi:hypothetical protein